jgi:hypothetical protein
LSKIAKNLPIFLYWRCAKDLEEECGPHGNGICKDDLVCRVNQDQTTGHCVKPVSQGFTKPKETFPIEEMAQKCQGGSHVFELHIFY